MKKIATLLVLALAAFAIVACGSDDDDSGTTAPAATTTESSNEATGEGDKAAAGGEAAASGSTVKISAVPGTAFEFTSTTVDAKAGNLTIDFDNPQSITHDVAVEDSSGEELGGTDLIAESTTSTTIDNLKPGKYTYFCTVPGHREAGMEGTLTVK